jgi:3-phenylpropionate/cinnamic acid dioxygenase small subunit
MRDAVESLLSEYARALDERRLEDWVACFAEEASYTVIPRSNLERGLRLCVMADESKARIRDRILFITKIWNENFTDYIPRHLYTLLTMSRTSAGIEVISNFAAYASEPDGKTLLLAVGEYRDLMVQEGDRLRFRKRQVVLDTEILPRYLVYPL